MAPLRLSTRLGLTHGVLAMLVLILLFATLQGLVRMLGLITDVRDGILSYIAAEEELHRAAWAVEVTVRHGRAACSDPRVAQDVRAKIESARRELTARRAATVDFPQALMTASGNYLDLATAAVEGDTCALLRRQETEDLRAKLDEELTNAWIDRLKDVHVRIQQQEDTARQIGVRTAGIGIAVALCGAAAAVLIARTTARSVTAPIAQLAREATRVGDGDFRPIPSPRGPREIEELWRDLNVMRQRLLELDQLKMAFLANVSHELRSPLTRVRAALSLLADGTCGKLSSEQQRVVTLAASACEREVRIVTALLDMSRLESGLPLKLESGGHIDRVLAAVIRDEQVDATERGVRIDLDAPGDVPGMEIDSALVERALANLVRNAVSVSSKGQVVRIVRSLVESEAGVRRIAVDVIDEGPGLPKEVREASFRPFAATSIAAIARPAGIGLGLSLAREVARAHEGELTLVHSDERGTTFRLELPTRSLSSRSVVAL